MERVWKKIQSKGRVIYEGFTVSGMPYGAGTAYFHDGTIYQEGVFDVKGLVYGREHYPNGKIRFEGAYKINHGYGPNYPVYGQCYDEDGNMYFEGKLSVERSGLGWPSVKMPKEFGSIPQSHPDLRYIDWSDLPCGKDDQQAKDDV